MKDKEKPNSYKERWLVGRKESKKLKFDSMNTMLEKTKGKDCYTKLSGLIQLYIDSHDTVTAIGLQIAIIADENI